MPPPSVPASAQLPLFRPESSDIVALVLLSSWGRSKRRNRPILLDLPPLPSSSVGGTNTRVVGAEGADGGGRLRRVVKGAVSDLETCIDYY